MMFRVNLCGNAIPSMKLVCKCWVQSPSKFHLLYADFNPICPLMFYLHVFIFIDCVKVLHASVSMIILSVDTLKIVSDLLRLLLCGQCNCLSLNSQFQFQHDGWGSQQEQQQKHCHTLLRMVQEQSHVSPRLDI